MRNRIIGFGIICVIGLFLVFNTYGEPPGTSRPTTPAKTPTSSPSPGDTTPLTKKTFADIVKKVSPSVVNVYCMGSAGGPWDTTIKRGDGSGFIIDSKKGILLTNHHVAVEGLKGLKIGLQDKRKFNAKVIGTDPIYDVGVVQIENPPPDLQQVVLGNSDKLAPGDWVIAIGQPRGMEYTVTVGIVSALGREIGIQGKKKSNEYVELYIQIDALINPGNSGGPLFNANGEVVGINTAGGNSYGFSIPINNAIAIKDKIIKEGKVIRASLGLIASDFNDDNLVYAFNTTVEDLVKDLQLKEAKGVFVRGCADDTPAQTAGFVESDVIIEMAGVKINDLKGYRAVLEKQQPGAEVKIKFMRKGKEETISVKLAEMGSPDSFKEENPKDGDE